MAACRGCGAPNPEVVLDLGDMPLANGLLSREDLSRPEPRYPLALAFCSTCYLAQITDIVPPEVLFREYAYYSSVSDAMVEHARELVAMLARTRGLDGTSLVIEPASNDGYLLQHYVARGIPVLGIEPARHVAAAAAALLADLGRVGPPASGPAPRVEPPGAVPAASSSAASSGS